MKTLFYRYPRLLLLALALIVVAGASAYAVLPRAEDPSLKGRVGRAVVRYPGADSARVDALVAEPLEQELLEVPEIHKLITTSRAGVSFVLIQLADEVTETAEVWTRVRAKLDDAERAFPPGASDVDFEEQEIQAYTLITAIRHEGEGPADLAAMGRLGRALRDRLRRVPGTEEVEIWGAVPEEILVDVSPAVLSSLGRSASDLADELARSDAKVSAGTLHGGPADLLLEVTGELDSLARVKGVPVRQASDGRVLRLGDAARVRRGAADPADEVALIGGQPAIVVAARMAEGRRIDRWAVAAKGALSEFRRELPRQLTLPVVFDQARYTDARLAELQSNLLLGVLLVIAVLVVLMGWRSALLVGLALPLTSLLVLAGMRILGVPLHQMSVTGLIIALGLLIDNAIVMVDEVEERLRGGLSPGDAIAASVGHLAVPLLGSTLTTVLAFMPMVLMPGPAGEFVGAIGLSVTLALVGSLFLALTIVPTLRVLLDRAQPSRAGAAAEDAPWWRGGLKTPALLRVYREALGSLLARPARGAVLVALPALLGFVAAGALAEQFFPPSDRDQVPVELRLPYQASVAETRAATLRAREVLLSDPAVEDVHWFVGRTAPKFYYNMISGQDGATFYAQGLVQLKSSEESAAVVAGLQRRLTRELPEAQALVKLLEQGPPFEAPVELHIYGPDPARLIALGERARGILERVPEVVLTRTTQASGRPQLTLALDEEHSRLLGVGPTEVASQLEGALRGARGGTVLEGSEEVAVRVRVEERARQTIGGLESTGVFGAVRPGTDIRRAAPVSALGELQLTPAKGSLQRRNGERINTVQGFVRAGVLPSTVLRAYLEALEREGFELPSGYRFEVGGESNERDQAVGNLLASAGVLLVLMVATLVLSFRSFRQAAVIGAVGMLAVGLAMASLWTFRAPFGFMGIVGTMGLIGVAINDAIVVLAAIREDPAASQGDARAVQAVVIRSTRHVVATTLTTIAGFVPLLVAGGAFWWPLAVTIAGGVAGATLLALTFVPCAFLVLIRLGMHCPGRAGAAELQREG